MTSTKKKVVRFAGFLAALGVSAVLVTTAVNSTGAYFTSHEDGNLSGTSGALKIDGDSAAAVDFTGLNPGEDKSQVLSFHIDGGSTTSADIWLVFDQHSQAYGAFTGAKDPTGTQYADDSSNPAFTGGGLGGYGHFKVESDQGFHFESNNLQLDAAADATTAYTTSNDQGTCAVSAIGNGGSAAKATGPDNGGQSAPECGVPATIEIDANVAVSAGGSVRVTFGLTGRATGSNQPFVNIPFKIVATQPGIRPDAANF